MPIHLWSHPTPPSMPTPRRKDEDEDTDLLCEHGSGSIYARVGSVRDWLLRQDEYTRQYAKDEEGDDDDD